MIQLETEGIIKRLKGGLIFLIIIIVLTYLAIFTPLSYLPISLIKPTWNSIVYFLFAIGCLCGGWYLVEYHIIKKKNNLFYLLSLLSSLFLFGITLTLDLSGLRPIRFFVPIIMAFSLFFIFYMLTLFDDLILKYKTYLAKSLYFVEEGANFLIVISVYYIVLIIRKNLPIPHLFSLSNIPNLILFVIKICLTIYFIYHLRKFVINIEINDRKSFSCETWSLAISVLIIEILNWYVYHSLDFWWTGVFALGISIFYVAQNPTKRKASFWLYIGVIIFIFFMLFGMLDIRFKISGWQVITSVITSIVIPAVGFLLGSWGFIKKKLFERKGKISITFQDVRETLKEIVEKDGFSLKSLTDILNICIISKHFSPAKDILKNYDNKIRSELKLYFKICLLCAEFYHTKRIEIETEENQKKIIVKEEEFKEYIGNLFPYTVSNLYLWDTYNRNKYVTEYVRPDIIEESKPSSILDKTKRVFSRAIIFIALFSFALNQIPIPLFSLIPSGVSKVISWNNFRFNEVRLKFTEAFEPYKDKDLKNYYANSMYEWIDNWVSYKGIQKGNVIFLSSKELKQIIHWFQLILSFYSEKNYLYFLIHKRLGILYKAVEEYDEAIEHLNLAFRNIEDLESKDFILSNMAECYFKKGAKESAVELLKEIGNSDDYHKSKELLAKYYFSMKDFSKVIKVLKAIPAKELTSEELFIIGESYYQMNKLEESKQVFEKIVYTKEYKNTPYLKTICSFRLGKLYFKNKEYFDAAEFLYISLSTMIMKNLSILTKEDIIKILPIYKEAIDFVHRKNPYDYRVNLWYFVYYFYKNDPDSALLYFKKHIKYSPSDYEREFTEFILIKAKKRRLK